MNKDPRVSFQKWVEKYEKETGEKVVLPQGYVLQFLPDRGFSEYKVDFDGSILIVYQACGDIRFWRDVAELIAQTQNLDFICTTCLLDIKAYLRMFGAEIVKEERHEEQYRFTCKDNLGRKVIVTHKGTQDNGKPCYWVTQHLKEFLNENEKE